VLDEVAAGILQAVAKYSQGTNMSLERLLALVRSASPTVKGRKPRASKMVVRGHLTQLIRDHLDAGMADNRGQESRKQLIASGVRCNLVSSRRREKGTTRWHIRYANQRVVERQVTVLAYGTVGFPGASTGVKGQ
jgi:hypothetical protein